MREKVLKGGFSLALRQIVSFPVNAAGTIIASRLLLPSDYAVQSYLAPVFGIAIFLIDAGVSKGIVQASEPPAERAHKQIQAYKFLTTVTCALVFTLVGDRLLSRANAPHEVLQLLPLCAIVGLLQSQRATIAARFQRALEWEKLARVEMLEIVAQNIALALFAWGLQSAWCFPLALIGRHSTGIMLLYFRGSQIGGAGAAAAVQGPSPALCSFVRLGLPLDSVNLIAISNNLTLPIIGASLLTIKDLGFLSWSVFIAGLVLLPLRPLPDFLLSVMAARHRDNRDDSLLVADLIVFGNFIVLLASFFVLRAFDTFHTLVFGPAWGAAVSPVHALAVANLITIPALMCSARLAAVGRSGIWLRCNIIGSALLWISCPVGTRYFGISGFAIAWLLSSVLAFLYLVVTVRRFNVMRLDIMNTLAPCLILGFADVLPVIALAQDKFSKQGVLWVVAPALALLWAYRTRRSLRSAYNFLSPMLPGLVRIRTN